MRRLALSALVFLVLCLPGYAEQFSVFGLSPGDPFTCNGATEGAAYENSTSHFVFVCNASAWTAVGSIGGSGTINTIPKFTAATILGNSTITDDGTTVTVNTRSTFRAAVDGSASENFLNITGTLPGTLTGEVHAIQLGITTAGSSAQFIKGLHLDLNAGYTGANGTVGIESWNFLAGTSTNWAANVGNVAVSGQSSSNTSGAEVSVQGVATNPGSGDAVGVVGIGNIPGTGRHVGVAGIAGGTNSTGGYFGINSGTVPTIPNAALVANNGTAAFPILVGQDNSSTVWQITDGGSQWAANQKTLTDAAAAVAFATVTLPSGSVTGGQIDYCIEVVDATPNYQNRCGGLVYTAVNKAGTLTIQCNRPGGSATLDQTTDFLASSSGTMTDTFTCVDGGSGTLQFKVTADSSLTPTTERINYSLRQWGNAAVAFTPQ
jgi:hypothetical protein